MSYHIVKLALGNGDELDLEHRCYNGVCLIAAFGCLLAALINPALKISLQITATTFIIGVSYLWLYYSSRRRVIYEPNLWLYITNGIVLLTTTWFFNGGIDGSDVLVSMVALVALLSVMKSHRLLVVFTVFLPTMTLLFLVEYFYPDLITAYTSQKQRFMDVYITFVISTCVISVITLLILKSYNKEKRLLNEANQLLNEKMDILNQTNLDLESAINEVQTLSGLLPICSSCKKIRDDKGYWNQIEQYIGAHTEAEFSHSICPDCSEKLYGNENWYIKLKSNNEID